MIWPFTRGGGRQGPGRVEALLQRGAGLARDGAADAAEDCYREALSLDPEHPDARRILAQAIALRALECQQRGDLAGAIEGYEESLALDAGGAQVRNNLGNAYLGAGRTEEAMAEFRQASAMDPALAEARLNWAMALERSGRYPEAIEQCRAALAIRPSFAEASASLGYLLEQEGDAAGALRQYRDAVAARPDYAEARFNYALQLLLQGEYAEGWREYEWRKRLPAFQGAWAQGAAAWDGAALEGRTILLFAEQGFGDVLQFARYAPLVAARGGRVVLRCQAPLKALLSTLPGVAAVVSTEEPLPAVDVSCSLLSLPFVFGTTLQSVPSQVPYLRADPQRTRHWQARLATENGRLKVGLFWSTDTQNRISAERSLTLDMLAPLGRVAGTSFVSLQRGEAARQAARPPEGMRLVDLGGELAGFADDAALMAGLDLVISVNTATAHLAGALGVPVWILAQFPPDWRWLLGRDDSPWYPSARLFRSPGRHRWPEVIDRVAGALAQRAGTG